ncbi:MAG TPA: 2-phospho-L-lactate transferase [Acidimicrobiales bacterium]|nr:2-phospho-L-lactate transferase [Acidimicrobiales bacterium]
MFTVLSGGVGAARLLRSLRLVVDDTQLTGVVNVGDDVVLHGLTICPDLDTICYTLAGLNNDELGWGLAGESWRVMDELGALGGESWFRLGDRDLATHLYRTQRLAEGATKSGVTRELCTRWGVGVALIPVTDDTVATVFDTAVGRLSFQEYFVQHRHDVEVTGVTVEGVETAVAAPGVLEAIARAARVVIAPSNPVISIEPILQVPGVRDALAARRDDVVAVSPLIAGEALKGPAARLMTDLGYASTSVGVADLYKGLISTMIVDEADADVVDELRARDLNVIVTTTVMSDEANARRLAAAVTT